MILYDEKQSNTPINEKSDWKREHNHMWQQCVKCLEVFSTKILVSL